MKTTTYCPFCGRPITEDDFATGDVADNAIFDFEGVLECIELAHAGCAPRGWATGPMTKEEALRLARSDDLLRRRR